MKRRMRMMTRALVLPALVLAGTAEFNATEIQCEEAVSHLTSCCPHLRVPNVCGGQGCAPDVTLTLAESRCILDTGCGPEAEAICQRLDELSRSVASSSNETNTSYGSGSSSTSSHGVCP